MNEKIPLTPVQQPNTISNLEEEAADLAKFLDLKTNFRVKPPGGVGKWVG